MASRFRHAVITGAGNGIGRAFALQSAAAGSRVSVVDIDGLAARRVAAEITVRGGEAVSFVCDVRDDEAVRELFADTTRKQGEVDLLVNNAGVLTAGAALSTPLTAMRNVFDVNLWGTIHGCSAFVPSMVERGDGHIINVASLAGMMSLPHMGAYGATKAAVIAYSETLAAEIAASGVDVTIVCPSLVNTGFVERGAASSEIRHWGARLLQHAGQSAAVVARVSLRAAAKRRRWALPSRSGTAALHFKRFAPAGFAWGAASLAGVLARLPPLPAEA